MPTALAIAAHPDDIEFVMAGTLLLLRGAGWDIHYFNLSTGNMGSTVMGAAETARVRRREAQAAAKALGAKWHAPICDDLQIFYTDENIRRICADIFVRVENLQVIANRRVPLCAKRLRRRLRSEERRVGKECA